ncbi:GapA-binding peptide SR1P [Neobacillus mesonae]|nr:GapA-binding peptide SR1P [Neobacillus mesonae]
MENNKGSIPLGVILCRDCYSELGVQETNRVQTFYSNCGSVQCREKKLNSEYEQYLDDNT